MTISTKVNSKFGLMLLSLGAATLFVGLTALPAHAIAPATATATSKVQYNIQSPGWILGTCTVVDNGNLYTEGLPSYPSATATVNWGSTVKSRSGTVTYNQSFVWGVWGGPIGQLDWTPAVQASAIFERFGQTAHAKAQFQMPFANISIFAEAKAQAVDFPDSDSFSVPAHLLPNVNTVPVIAVCEADASTP